MPLLYYRKLEDNARRDSDECRQQTSYIRVDPIKKLQWFSTFDGLKILNTAELLEDFPTAGNQFVSYTGKINPTILCTSQVSFNPKKATETLTEILSGGPEAYPSKGRYLVACNGTVLCNRLENEVDFHCSSDLLLGGPVLYVSSKDEIRSPFCKLQKFSFEHEYRFVFPGLNQPHTFHLKPIPGMIFDLKDNCRIIYNNINQVKP